MRKGKVDHAIRFTTDVTDRRYVWPARHQAGAVNNRNYPPMVLGSGSRRRTTCRSIDLRRASSCGRCKSTDSLADNGPPGTSRERLTLRKWPSRLIEDLKSVPARAFVAVDTSSLMVNKDSARVHR